MLWGCPVPKEAVVTFTGVVEDMGADRGLMFSEKGYEAGAIHQANYTDVLLTGVLDFADSGLTGSSNRSAGQRSVHTGDQKGIQTGRCSRTR